MAFLFCISFLFCLSSVIVVTENSPKHPASPMLICRVVGDVVSTVKNRHLEGEKLLIVQPVDLDCETEKGASLIALDRVDAGPNDLVLVNREGGGARMILGKPQIPVQAVIVAVIDAIDTSGAARINSD